MNARQIGKKTTYYLMQRRNIYNRSNCETSINVRSI